MIILKHWFKKKKNKFKQCGAIFYLYMKQQRALLKAYQALNTHTAKLR